MSFSMQVIKRDGRKEAVSFDKVLDRVRRAARGLSVNPDTLAQQILSQIYDGVKTSELDELTAQLAASLSTAHPDYGTLAARISISNHHKNTNDSFSTTVRLLANQTHPKTGESICSVSKDLLCAVNKFGDQIDSYIQYDRDYLFDYFGFKTLEKSYLLRDTSMRVVERPQHMWMRVALGLWMTLTEEEQQTGLDLQTRLARVLETYDLMSQKFLTHATPTLFNAGTPRPQLSSCFLLAMNDDSISGIYKTLSDCASISKYAGGIGLHAHNIRARGSLIRGTNGTSNGLTPMLRVFNNTARYVDQCFLPGTLVYTKMGAKPIETISVTDQVLTSLGQYESVDLPVRHNYNGKILKIQTHDSISSIQVTPEHQIFALKGQANEKNIDIIRQRLNHRIATPEFTDAIELQVGDFVVYPIPQYTADIESLTEDDCRLYGIILGNAHITDGMVVLSLQSESKKDVAEFVVDFLSKRGIPVDMGETIQWSFHSPGFKFVESQFYKIETAMLHLPHSKIIQILRGFIETNGFDLSSNHVFEDVRYMLLRLGALPSKTIPLIPEIAAFFPGFSPNETLSYLRHNNFIYSRIESISEDSYCGTVHDFEIAGTHDYTVAHLGIVHNGGGRRNGSFAIYLEPWHADVEDFLKMKLPTGAEEERARDLFYALWIPDLFMERVEADGNWSLFCPNEAPGLADVVGTDFQTLYEQYEKEGRARKTVKAQKLWFQILDTQMETGTPYLLYKDAANKKSNQQNLGVIKSSNLCSEIIEYSSPDETAVCNLASIALPSFVSHTHLGGFDFEALRKVVTVAVRNLNRVIDINFYPTPETQRSNLRHRPIGIGIQGLADVFALLGIGWESEEAIRLNRLIFEHMYYAAVSESANIAMNEGTYERFQGSPISQGKLQPDLWGEVPYTEKDGSLNWNTLRENAKKGVRNSLLMAPMPTASTSQILGFNECFEPFTSNIYTRRTLAGEFIVINKYLLKDLMAKGVWSEHLKQKIVAQNGSVQGITEIPEDIQARYKTAWELKQRVLIDMAADRGAFICQSQSLNLFVADATYSKLTSMHFYAWKKGLKTGCYYLRTKSPVTAQKFTVDPRMLSGSIHQAPIHDQEEPYHSDSDSDSDSEKEETPVVSGVTKTREQERRDLLERLAREYEEEQAKGCVNCSS
jgi:ribonucleoside-diphosphate reductase alpha subunit